MNRSAIRRVAAPSVAALALGLALSACTPGNESGGTDGALSGIVRGAGSSAQESAMKAWRAGFQTANPKVTINYDPSGSGAGVEKFNEGATDFAGSDAALNADKGEIDAAKERCGANAFEIPSYISPIAVVFSLKGVDSINLSAKTIAQIFDGKITTWNDPAIVEQNVGVTLPSTSIVPVHRSDESGTTKNFTDYLAKASEGAWSYDADKVWPINSGEGANGTSGVIAAIKDGSIGYADESQVGDLSTVAIKVGDQYVAPSAEGAAIALAASPVDEGRTEGDLAIKVDRTTTAPGAYPLSLLSYLIACPTYEADKVNVIKGFLTYVISSEGQAAAAGNAGSAPLPESLQTKATEIIAMISAK